MYQRKHAWRTEELRQDQQHPKTIIMLHSQGHKRIVAPEAARVESQPVQRSYV